MPPNKSKNSGPKSGNGELVDGPRGGKLRRGSKPGNTPGTGRPPDEFKRRMREIATQQEVEEYFDRCIKGKFGPAFHLKALEHAADRGYGRPTQSVVEYDFNPDDFSVSGLERVAAGEDPVHVLSTGGRKLPP
jgi:hypothetical protein